MTNAEAIIVLPPGAGGRIKSERLRAWLSRGQVGFGVPLQSPLEKTLVDLDAPLTDGSGAALRYWGEKDERPVEWLAGADPVWLRPRMRDVVVEVLPPDLLPETDIRELFTSLQSELEGADDLRLESDGRFGYLFSDMPFGTASVSGDVMQGRVPDCLNATGDSLEQYHRINTEIQMLLHEHPVNQRRQGDGLPPINSLWLWGGGVAPQPELFPLPKLYADDPLFRGYWLAHGVKANSWPGDLETCCDFGSGSFVAVPPATEDSSPDPWLSELKQLMVRGRFSRLIVNFRDELCAELKYQDQFRFWKPVANVLQENSPDE